MLPGLAGRGDGRTAPDKSRRLAYYNLEVRDYYFSRLKSRVELFKKQNKQKVVLCSHSYVLAPASVALNKGSLTASGWVVPSFLYVCSCILQTNTDVTFLFVDSTCEPAVPSVPSRARAEASASNGSRRIPRFMGLAVEGALNGSTSTSSRGSMSRALCSAFQRR